MHFRKAKDINIILNWTTKTISHEKSRIEIVLTQVKFNHQFHFTGTFKCSYELQRLFSTFGVVKKKYKKIP